MLVVTLDVCVADPGHQPGKVSVFVWPEQQVPMIGHQTKVEQPAWNALQALGQDFDERVEVSGFVKDAPTPIGTVENVIM